MANTATKINSQSIETVDVSLLLLLLNKVKKEAGQSLGKNESLKKELDSKIDSIFTEEKIETINDKINDLAQTIFKSPEISNGSEIGMMAKKIELATEELIRKYPKEVEILKQEKFKKNFREESKKINPSLSENQLKNLNDYADLVANNSFSENILDGQKNEALEINRGFGPGKLENAWTDLKQMVNFLQKSPEEIKNIKDKYNSLKENLRGVNLPSNSKEARSFEKIMAGFNDPNTDQLFSRTKKYLGWADRVDKLTGGWLNKTVTEAGLKFVGKIGNQAIQEFATNALGTIAKEGFQKGFTTVLKGVLSGGVKAVATTGAKVVVTTGTKVAIETVGGLATGGVLTIAMIALDVLNIIKKIGNKIAEKLGISTKKFFEENFGKVGGKAVKGIIYLVGLPSLLIGSLSSVVIGPVLILIIGGLFFYQMMQGNQISSLVPPEGVNDYVEEIEEPSNKDDYYINDPTSGDIVMPTVPKNFTRQDLINVAMALKGNVDYFFGGKYNNYGPNPEWGKLRWNTRDREYKPYGLDCSGFVNWVYYQLIGRPIAGGASSFATQGWQKISRNNLKTGDIAWRHTSKGYHVAIYLYEDNGIGVFIEAFDGINLRSDEARYDGHAAMSFDAFYRPDVDFYGD